MEYSHMQIDEGIEVMGSKMMVSVPTLQQCLKLGTVN